MRGFQVLFIIRYNIFLQNIFTCITKRLSARRTRQVAQEGFEPTVSPRNGGVLSVRRLGQVLSLFYSYSGLGSFYNTNTSKLFVYRLTRVSHFVG